MFSIELKRNFRSRNGITPVFTEFDLSSITDGIPDILYTLGLFIHKTKNEVFTKKFLLLCQDELKLFQVTATNCLTQYDNIIREIKRDKKLFTKLYLQLAGEEISKSKLFASMVMRNTATGAVITCMDQIYKQFAQLAFDCC